MLIETGADPADPPSVTGGCKLTKDQVQLLTEDLIAFQNNAAPGLKFAWDSTDPDQFVILEADCLKLQPPPFQPCISRCSLTDVVDNCPRKITLDWFRDNVVGKGPEDSGIGLQQVDNFDDDDCAVNIYYVGNIFGAAGSEVWGVSWTPPSGRRFAVINDGAGTDPSESPAFQVQVDRKTVLHEVIWHAMADLAHPTFMPGSACPDLLGVSGSQLDHANCASTYAGKRPTGMSQQAIDSIRSRYSSACENPPPP